MIQENPNERLYTEINNFAVKMIEAPTKEEQKANEIKLFEKIYRELIKIDGDKVYIKYTKSGESYSQDDFQAIVLYLLTPVQNTGEYRYKPANGDFITYLEYLCSKRKGEGFRTEYERFKVKKQNEYQKKFKKKYGRKWVESDGYKDTMDLQNIDDVINNSNEGGTPYGNPENFFEEEHVPNIVEALTPLLQRLDLEEGEGSKKKVIYKGKIWIKLTYESMKYIKETMDKDIQEELKQKNTWNKDKFAFDESDVEFRHEDTFERLKNLISYMYPFALDYYYETRPRQTAEMYHNPFYEMIEVKEFSLPPFPLEGKRLQQEHLRYCVNQFLAGQGVKKPMELDNMKKWMTTNYSKFIQEIGRKPQNRGE